MTRTLKYSRRVLQAIRRVTMEEAPVLRGAFKLILILLCLHASRCQDTARDPLDLQISNETSCELTSSCDDIAGFEAIRALHRQLDDDASGTVDISETDEFIRDELQNPNGNERQIKAFHGSDTSISVLEMWHSWKKSEVHNWTVEETVSWLVDSVELPQYARLFHENRVDGRVLPRMAVQNNAYLANELGIKDPISKQKLVLKAMDVVLFGPQRNHNWLKDVILAVVLIFATTTVWFLYRQNRRSQLLVRKMMKDLDALQSAEDSLLEMQIQLDKARIEQESLQEEILNQKKDGLAYSDPDSMIFKLQEEVRFLQEELAKERNMSRGMAHPQLQHWLQLTHEIELKNYLAKKAAAKTQLRKAKEECEKLRRKGQSFMGPFRLTHGGSIDDIDTTILLAKQALSELTHDLTERLHRWRQIEMLCGFNIVSNRGLVQLEALLHGRTVMANSGHHPASLIGHSNNNNTPTAGSTKSVISRSGSEGTLSDEDSPGSSCYNNNNMSSVASAAGLPVLSSKTANVAYGVGPGGRRVQPPQTLYSDYYAQQVMQQQQSLHSSLFPGHHGYGGTPGPGVSPPGAALFSGVVEQMPMASTPGTPPRQMSSSHLSGLRREEPDGDLTPQIGQTPVLFQVGSDNLSPTMSESGSSFGGPVVNSSRGVLLKGSSIDGSTDGAFGDEDSNSGRLGSSSSGGTKPKRKGSALMNAIRSSFTSSSTLIDPEEHSSRGSTPAFDEGASQRPAPRKKTGVLGAIKKISRGNKDNKAMPDRDS